MLMKALEQNLSRTFEDNEVALRDVKVDIGRPINDSAINDSAEDDAENQLLTIEDEFDYEKE
jgi:hypothetical protein